ncbi:hypothetical protein PPYR_00048 [Photinus pyralis]|uniref:Uncharacterized protein n=1 Tax=Photinus pyralis TaxID=7054 RepID=A0A5N4B0N8_PHOPY|nr:hypothetical protein PPYR_00048 [Photinus pyralis]
MYVIAKFAYTCSQTKQKLHGLRYFCLVSEHTTHQFCEKKSGNPDAASSIIFFDNGESTTQEQKRDLNSILNCNEGRELLQTYALQKIVKRRALVKLIIDDELRNNPDKRIERDRFVYLAQEIQRTFPTENAGIYYVQGYRDMEGKAVGNHGKLWDKYINTRRKYRSLDIIPSTPAKKTKPNQPNPRISFKV